ncbi:MAG TPA: hypothetical protein VF111_06460 [Thermoanaerobaculia bacterium]
MQTFLLALFLTTQSLSFEASYTAVITDVPAGAKVWVPVPRTTATQRVGELRVHQSASLRRSRERGWAGSPHHTGNQIPIQVCNNA